MANEEPEGNRGARSEQVLGSEAGPTLTGSVETNYLIFCRMFDSRPLTYPRQRVRFYGATGFWGF